MKPDPDHRSNACMQLAEQDVLDRMRERRAEAELARAARGAGRAAVRPTAGSSLRAILRRWRSSAG